MLGIWSAPFRGGDTEYAGVHADLEFRADTEKDAELECADDGSGNAVPADSLSMTVHG